MGYVEIEENIDTSRFDKDVNKIKKVFDSIEQKYGNTFNKNPFSNILSNEIVSEALNTLKVLTYWPKIITINSFFRQDIADRTYIRSTFFIKFKYTTTIGDFFLIFIERLSYVRFYVYEKSNWNYYGLCTIGYNDSYKYINEMVKTLMEKN